MKLQHIRRPLTIAIVLLTLLSAETEQNYYPEWSLSWDQFTKNEMKIGLALGGGAALGAVHIGVLKALDELDITIDYIAGTSIGAFVSALYAFGKDWREIETIAENMNWTDLSALSFSNLGLLSNKKMGDLIEEYIGNVNMEDSPLPLAMIAADIVNLKKVVLTRGNVAQAVMASTCIPAVFVPVEIDGKLLVDGGLVESVPLSPLREMGADLIIAVNLNSEYSSSEPENIIDILLRTFLLTTNTTTKIQLRNVNILISPDLSGFNFIDISQSTDLIEVGYREAMRVLRDLYR